MTQAISFIIGILVGGFLVWLIMRARNKQSINQRVGGGLAEYNQRLQEIKTERKIKILELLKEQEKITNTEVRNLLAVSDATATNYLQELEEEDKIEQKGKRGRSVYYQLKFNG